MSQALCNAAAGTCTMPTCSLNQWRCSNRNLQQCLPDLTGWMTVMMCAQTEICDAAGHECDQCTAGQAQCVMPEILQTCDAQGHWMSVDCAPAQVCDETLMPPMCVDPPLMQ
jgi:hypothetical protein